MSTSTITTEQHVLNASGLLAIVLTAAVCFVNYEPWPSLALNLVFMGAFVVGAYGVRMGLPPASGRLSILFLLLTSVGALWVTQDTVVLILSIVLMASAPYHLSARYSWLLILIANGVYWWVLSLGVPYGEFLFSWISLLALQAFALSSSLARQREVSTKELLERKNGELVAARALIARQSQTEERLRIAGDLHDAVGHQLTALRLNLEAAAHEDRDGMQEQLKRCQALASAVLEDIRGIVRRMASEEGKELKSAIRELDAMTPEVSIRMDGNFPSLNPVLSQQLVFCFQEAISNAIRHGRATEIVISYGGSSFIVEDNGRGIGSRPLVKGFGLKNIKARLEPYGGVVKLSPGDSGGTCLRMTLEADLEPDLAP